MSDWRKKMKDSKAQSAPLATCEAERICGSCWVLGAGRGYFYIKNNLSQILYFLNIARKGSIQIV